MKLLVDAQLPKRLARWLTAQGHDTLHTLDMEQGNRTSDAEIADLACLEERIVVTKDGDFVDSHLVQGRPSKLLLIATGNMTNAELELLMKKNLATIESALETSAFVELGRDHLIVHD
jgi:predicted nuclease of predicted toxin-antitoxin system